MAPRPAGLPGRARRTTLGDVVEPACHMEAISGLDQRCESGTRNCNVSLWRSEHAAFCAMRSEREPRRAPDEGSESAPSRDAKRARALIKWAGYGRRDPLPDRRAPERRPQIPPSAAFVAAAHVSDAWIYDQAAADPEAFWARFASELEWIPPWSKVLEWKPPHARWFVGGKLNARVNCVDRHVRNGRRNKAAIVWEGEPGDVAR